MPNPLRCCLWLPLWLSTAVGAGTGPSPTPTPVAIELRVDVSDIDRNIQRVEQHIAVEPGPLTLLYPQWIPGHHAPTGAINQIAGLSLRSGDRVLRWQRDPTNMYAFHVDIPPGAQALDIEFQYFSPTAANQGRIATTTQMLALQWHRVVLYPAGRPVAQIPVQAQVRLPTGWSFASALDGAQRSGDTVRFAPTTLETLVDSPLYAARHLRSFTLDDGKAPVRLQAMADSPDLLQATPAVLAAHKALVSQADRVFGARPFAHYDFLLATSAQFSAIGLEHLQSSENGQPAGYLLGESPFIDNDLLAHEYVHAWNGKYRRPVLTATPDYNTPMRNELLWLYEGQTQYWAFVLSARARLRNAEQTQAVLAMLAATAQHRSGRRWRDLQDTVNEGIIEFNDAPQAWEDWQRSYDFYDESVLLWLDVDARLRELSANRRSLDAFARNFFAGGPSPRTLSTYREADIGAALTQLHAGEDWPAFLRERLDAHADYTAAALARAGWRLCYRAERNAAIADAEAAHDVSDFSYSLGLRIANADGRLDAVLWDSPAWRAGLARDTYLVAVNDTAWNRQRVQQALLAAQRDATSIRLLVRRGDDYRTVSLDYRDGPREPCLERITGTPDRLGAILQAR